MTDTADLNRRFNNMKQHLSISWEDNGITTQPTDKEIWGQMRAVAMRNRDEAMMDDMQGFVEDYDIRIALIDERLKAL